MNGKLKQGKWYWNTSERLLYKVEEVVEVDGDDWLAVHLEDGSRRTWNARALAAVSSLTDPPWWRRPLTPLIADELRSRGSSTYIISRRLRICRTFETMARSAPRLVWSQWVGR